MSHICRVFNNNTDLSKIGELGSLAQLQVCTDAIQSNERKLHRYTLSGSVIALDLLANYKIRPIFYFKKAHVKQTLPYVTWISAKGMLPHFLGGKNVISFSIIYSAKGVAWHLEFVNRTA